MLLRAMPRMRVGRLSAFRQTHSLSSPADVALATRIHPDLLLPTTPRTAHAEVLAECEAQGLVEEFRGVLGLCQERALPLAYAHLLDRGQEYVQLADLRGSDPATERLALRAAVKADSLPLLQRTLDACPLDPPPDKELALDLLRVAPSPALALHLYARFSDWGLLDDEDLLGGVLDVFSAHDSTDGVRDFLLSLPLPASPPSATLAAAMVQALVGHDLLPRAEEWTRLGHPADRPLAHLYLGYVQQGRYADAAHLYTPLLALPPSSLVYRALFHGAFKTRLPGLLARLGAEDEAIRRDPAVWAAAITALVRHEDVAGATVLFHDLSKYGLRPSLPHYLPLIEAYLRAGDGPAADAAYAHLRATAPASTSADVSRLVHLYASHDVGHMAERAFDDFIRSDGVPPTSGLYDALLLLSGRTYDLARLRRVVDALHLDPHTDPSARTLSILIGAYGRCEDYLAAISTWDLLRDSALPIHPSALANFFDATGRAGIPEKAYGVWEELDPAERTPRILDAFIECLVRSSHMSPALDVLDHLPPALQQDIVPATVQKLAAAIRRKGTEEEAARLRAWVDAHCPGNVAELTRVGPR